MSRYIDADKFYVSQVARCWGEPIIGTCTSDNALLYDELQKIPISDVVEVKHGEWTKDDSDGCYCSFCGWYADYDYDYVTNNGLGNDDFIYCGHCGAKMRGEHE